MKALIEISGTGGELVVCPISAEAHDYWSNKSEENLEQYISDGNLEGHPKNSDFALDDNGEHKSWFELDELGHFMGAHPNNCNLVVKVKSGNEFREVYAMGAASQTLTVSRSTELLIAPLTVTDSIRSV